MNWLVTSKKQEESQQDMSVYRMLFQVHVWSKHFETSLLLESNLTLFMECIYQDGELRFNIHFWEHFGFYGMS